MPGSKTRSLALLAAVGENPGGGVPSPDVIGRFHPAVDPCTLDFGDGSPRFTGRYPALATHTWTRPGTYAVTTTARDGDGNTTSWSTPVYVRPPIAPRVSVSRGRGGWTLTARLSGGDGALLAAHWVFADGSDAWGTQVRRAGAAAPRGAVTVTDGDGATATASFGS